MPERRIDELSNIEFNDNQQLNEYIKRSRGIVRDLFNEFSWSAEELRAVLATVPGAGHTLAMGLDNKYRARQVTQHLFRAAEATQTAGIEIVRTHQAFRKHFGEELRQAKSGKPKKPQFTFVDE